MNSTENDLDQQLQKTISSYCDEILSLPFHKKLFHEAKDVTTDHMNTIFGQEVIKNDRIRHKEALLIGLKDRVKLIKKDVASWAKVKLEKLMCRI